MRIVSPPRTTAIDRAATFPVRMTASASESAARAITSRATRGPRVACAGASDGRRRATTNVAGSRRRCMDSPESKAIRLENVVRCPRIGQPFNDGRVISAAGVRNFLFARRSRISPTQSMRRTPCLLSVITMSLLSSPAGAQSPDWAATASETLAHLQRLIRINTVNPPGNELAVAQYLDSTLKAEGIETHL